MRKILIVALNLCIVFAYAQKGNDMVYLKNGSAIKGTIANPNDSTVSITTQDGSVFVYGKTDISKAVIKRDTSKASSQLPRLWIGFDVGSDADATMKIRKQAKRYPDLHYSFPPYAGFNGGFHLYDEVSPVFGIESGLNYRLMRVEEKDMVTSAPYGTYTLENFYHALEIPLLVNFHTKGQKVKFFASLGLSAGVIVAAVHKDYVYNLYGRDTTFRTHIDSTTSFYCTAMVRAGIDIRATKTLLIKVNGTFTLSSGTMLGSTNFYSGYSANFDYHTPPSAVLPYTVGAQVAFLFAAPKAHKKKE